MVNMRKRYDAKIRAKVALEAVKGDKTLAELSSEFKLHTNQIRKWRKQLLECLPDLFTDRRKKKDRDTEELISELYRQIGQMKVELDWLKKKSNAPVKKKRQEVEPENEMISVSRQCELLRLNRSSYYYKSERDDSYNEYLMRLIDEQYTRTPFFGVPKMLAWLQRQGHWVNIKRVRRLMRLMRLYAIYPKPRLSKSDDEHKKYPYLLKGVTVDHPDQAWASDITYIRLLHGFVYLVVIMDWFSRYVLSWELSITLDRDFCIDALKKSLLISKPEIFNSDQGPQYTSEDFINVLKNEDIRISMDGRGRLYDNIFVERLWRTVKYEEVYLHDYLSVPEARERLAPYFNFYNTERPHASLGNQTPYEVYYGLPPAQKAVFVYR
ncbi:MAG: IS3 family transposase [Candidatus Aminicenantes bacterium]|nr:MAG: IS3 family transposase [Candidatus Aminicenantes bacterium]